MIWRNNAQSNKTNSPVYVLHNLQEHSSVSQLLILDLNVDKSFFFSPNFGTKGSNCFNFIFNRINIASVEVSVFRKLYVELLNLKTSSMIAGLNHLRLRNLGSKYRISSKIGRPSKISPFENKPKNIRKYKKNRPTTKISRDAVKPLHCTFL